MAVQPKLPSGKGAMDAGQLKGKAAAENFGKPMETQDPGVGNMNSLKNDIGEMSGFQADSGAYLVKKGTPYGEGAKFNFLPPGMDISNQENVDIRNMELKKVVDTSYPGDGWEPHPRDIQE